MLLHFDTAIPATDAAFKAASRAFRALLREALAREVTSSRTARKGELVIATVVARKLIRVSSTSFASDVTRLRSVRMEMETIVRTARPRWRKQPS